MRCPQCQHENREEAKFCEACGSKLELSCPSCGNQVRPGAAFCDNCGTSLTGTKRKRRIGESGKRGKEEKAKPKGKKETPSNSKPRTPDSGLTSAERRQLTVMFCDLVGSTALSERLDPEEWRAVVQGYQAMSAEVIRHFDGHIAQYLGDGLLVYFGYPIAHEDDAQRAARTGLGILAALHDLNARRQPAVQVRIGIHTGLVVVGEIGDGGKREQLALGDTPNIAARLQGLAAPDTVVISAATYRLIEGLLDCRDFGVHTLKGVSTPTQVYQVVGESGVRSRLDAAATKGLTPLVGREEEVGLLLRRWEQSRDGAGQVVMLNGEAGIGKSRLVQILKEHVAEGTYARVECYCSPYYQNSAFYPLIDHLQRLLQFNREDSSEEKLRKLERGASMSLPPETIALFASLLSIPLSAHYPPLTLTPQRQKQKTLEALLAWLLQEAERQPVLVVVEDLHWVDPSTLEFLSLLIDQVPTTRLLLLLTFRPDFSPPWAMLSQMTQLTLSRLARRQVEVMVEKVTGGKTLPAEVVQQLVTKTDGVPLFVEELTKMVLESVGAHGGAPVSLAIPTTLHDSLMARLDRLPTAKEVAQLGATLGREFSYELIQAVSPVEEKTLQSALAKLVEAELLYQRGLAPQARYVFKHALIQDAAYQSLLKSTRQQYHQQIAQVLEEQFLEIKETQPELLAHHYTEAGLIAQAIPFWQKAGQGAAERSAHVEAISHLTKGLELLSTFPDTPERVQQELTLQIALGPALMATKGYAAPEVEKAYLRARELCQQVGEPPQLLPVLVALWVVYIQRGNLARAYELGEQCLTLAQRVPDPALLLQAHIVLGITLFWLGEFTPARVHLEQGVVFYDPQKHHPLAFLYYGLDPGVFCLSWLALTLWNLGYVDQALKRSHEETTLAQGLSHPFSSAFASDWAAWLHQLCRERQAVQGQAEAAISLSIEQGFPFYLAWGTIIQGWALAEQGQGAQGIARMRQGLAGMQATGAVLWRPYHLALLAETCGKTGQTQEGLTVLAEALDIVQRTGTRLVEAELYRLKGELSLQSGVRSPRPEVPSPQPLTPNTQAEAEACFHKAIEIARQQQAKSLELRAVMSLSRLWQQQGKKAEARQMLAEIYGWFTEGFDTADLQEAKALLEELERRKG
jgi:class 3 adenylate cyclase/predicted ATPase